MLLQSRHRTLMIAVLVAATCLSLPVHAATVNASLTFDFTGRAAASDLINPGNNFSFADDTGAGINVSASAWIGSNIDSFTTGVALHSGVNYADYGYKVKYDVSGLGVCSAGGLKACLRDDRNFGLNHQSDISKEWLMLTTDSQVQFESLTLSPINTKKGGVIIYSATIDPRTSLPVVKRDIFGKPLTFDYSRVNGDQVVDLNSLSAGNVLLIGAEGRGSTAFVATNLRVRTTVVPIPSAVWLLGSALILLAGQARRQKF